MPRLLHVWSSVPLELPEQRVIACVYLRVFACICVYVDVYVSCLVLVPCPDAGGGKEADDDDLLSLMDKAK